MLSGQTGNNQSRSPLCNTIIIFSCSVYLHLLEEYTKVSVVPMHFIFAQKFFLYSRHNGPQKTCVRADKVGFFSFLLRRSNAIFSLF